MEQSDAKEYGMIAEWRLVEEAMIGEWMMTGEVIKVTLKWKADMDQIMPAQSFVAWKREAGSWYCTRQRWPMKKLSRSVTHRQNDP